MNHLSVDLPFLIYTQIATLFGEFDEKTGKFAGPSLGVIALTEAIITAVGGQSCCVFGMCHWSDEIRTRLI